MFSTIANLLALIPMLLHSVLGCCWHHEHHRACGPQVACHAADEPAAEIPKHVHDHSAACPNHIDAGGDAADDDSDHPCPHPPCSEQRCAVVSTIAGAGAHLILEGLTCQAPVFVVVSDPPLVTVPSVGRSEEHRGWLVPLSAQRRALAQIWRI